MKKILSIAFILISINAFSQVLDPVKWSFSVNKISETEAELIFKAKIDDKWHLYSQFLDEGGPIPTSFNIKDDKNFKKVGKTSETPKPESVYDEMFAMNVKYFSKKATFTQKIKLTTNKAFNISGTIDYMVCDDGRCIPLDKEFQFEIPASEQSSTTEIVAENVDTNSLVKNDTIVKDTAIVETQSEESLNDKNTKSSDNWFLVFLFAFIAGVLTLITPCVFPMIPMTISYFMKGNKPKSEGYKQAYFFGFSIIVIFAILGLILTLIFGKDAMYLISTHWIPNTFFFLVFMFFALSFFGLFEITLPSWMINKSDKQADKGGYVGVFFIALTTVLVSFSCTGPILGAALIELSSGSDNSLVFFISMTGFAFGFALPFTLLAMFPAVLNKLKSGSWLNTVKIVFGFIEIALGLKFLSMADLGANWGILDRETFLSLWIVVFTLLGFYLLGKLKFKGDSDLKSISVYRLFLSIITFSFVVYMIPGLWGAPLKVLSGYVPPLTSQDFDINRTIYENRGNSNENNVDLGDRKYSEILHLPTGFSGFFDLEEAKAYAKKVNKPIFLDFTGKTCANCREMENNVWNDLKVKQFLNDEYVVVALYADANFIELDKNDWITTEEGKIIKTLGKKNLNYQITKFKMNAQPYYVLMDANEKVLTEPRAYNLDVEGFLDFLENGVKEFKKLNTK
jgi:thiol:disulfide interchange protein DsbD